MSINSEISRILQAKEDLKAAIELKGVTVPSASRINDYPALVGQISGGGGSGSSELPTGYTRYDYIEGDGTNGLETPVTGECVWSMTFQSTDSGAKQFVGCSSTWLSYGCRTSTGAWGYSNDSGYYITGLGTNPKLHIEITFFARKFCFLANGDLVYKSITQDMTYTAQWCLLKLNREATTGMAAKLWQADCWKGSALAFHGIPCKRNSDNAAGLYDTVSGTFITASGFTVGNDI
jgi:hypothetical protein